MCVCVCMHTQNHCVVHLKLTQHCKATACVCAKSLQSHLTLYDPVDGSPPGSSAHGILQARILERLPCPPPRGLPHPGTEPTSFMLALSGRFSNTSATFLLLTV